MLKSHVHYAWTVILPLLLCLSGCGLVLDLDPDDQEGTEKRDGGGDGDAGGGTSDGGMADAGDGSVDVVDAGSVDAALDAARPPGCGDGVVDSETEQCDDGNEADGDGCDRDCTWSCLEDDECQDGDVCNGEEYCDLGTHTCKRRAPLMCEAPDACHAVTCDPREGCLAVLMDVDGDGHAPTSLGSCGTDCDDSDPTVYTGAVERCDGIDHDCDGSVESEVAEARCYRDADGDAFGDPLDFTVTCEACETGWVARPGDCYDADADVNPDQRMFFHEAFCADTTERCFDYDCNGVEEKRWTEVAPTCALLGAVIGCAPGGWEGAIPECGETGTWSGCEPTLGGLTCAAVRSSRTQECR